MGIPHTTYRQTTYHIPHTTYHIPHTKVYSFKHTWEHRTCTTSRFIGQLPRVSTEDRDRVVSVFEFVVLCLFFDCQQIGQLPRVSTEDTDRVVSVFEFFVCLFFVCLLVCKF